VFFGKERTELHTIDENSYENTDVLGVSQGLKLDSDLERKGS